MPFYYKQDLVKIALSREILTSKLFFFFFFKEASDDIINCYLLQLAQALKHESYFQCDLVEFLMERALKNQHIGHHLFWELKAEMNSPTHSKCFLF